MKRAVLATVLAFASGGCAAERASLDPSEIGASSPADSSDLKQAVTALAAARNNALPLATASLAAPAADLPPSTTQSTSRLVVYTAAMRIVVASTADSVAAVKRIAEAAGGYLQESETQAITVRVPASAFETTLAALDRLGEVTDRSVRAADVSEQMLDLDVRLDNIRRTRDRLAAHLAKSEKMEDTIRLEAELARVTTELERLEASRRRLESQVAMSTIRVELNAARPQTVRGEAVNSPFRWIDRLGDGLAGVAEGMPREPVFLGGGPNFEPPPGFVRYYTSKERVEAMNADGVRLRVVRSKNFDRAPVSFWRTLARKSLVENRAVAISREGPIDKRSPWEELAGTREVSGKSLGYVLLLSRTNDDVYAMELWGDRAAVGQLTDAVQKSAETLRR